MGKLDPAWRKSSYSGANGGNCVEVAVLREGGRVLVGDTNSRAGVILRFSSQAWRRFVGQTKADA
jgi:hypothetical protein